MSENKEYYPEKISGNPLPNHSEVVAGTSTPSTSTGENKSFGASEQKPVAFPFKVIARDTIGHSLDTKGRKILGDFKFGTLGAISIGTYENGVSGDIRITPNGLVARNVNGETTIAIDGTTGDATYKGTISAGSVISGNIIVGGADNDDGYISVLDASNNEKVRLDKDGIVVSAGKITVQDSGSTTILDSYGLVSGANFPFSQVSSVDTSDTTSSNTWTDVTDMSIDVTTSRSQQVLIMAKVTGGETNGGFSTTSPNACQFRILVDGSQVGTHLHLRSSIRENGGTTTYILGDTSISLIATVGAGTKTIKIQYRSSVSGKSVMCTPSLCQLTVFKMGA